jgi:hypothetical protein
MPAFPENTRVNAPKDPGKIRYARLAPSDYVEPIA